MNPERRLPSVSRKPSVRPFGAPRSGALRRIAFVGGACAGLLGVLFLGWLTPLRGVMHTLLIQLGSAALLPIAIVLGALALVAALSLVVGLVAEDVAVGAAGRAAIGGTLVRVYEAYIARQRRRPLLWGLAAGLALGVVGVWLVLAALVIPLETRTLSVLLLAQARLDAGQHPSAQRPGAAADGLLHLQALKGGSTGDADDRVLDAFGHAVAYEPTNASGATRYTLRSLGLDTVPSRDDLCVLGPTELTRSGDGAHDPLQFVEKLRADELGWSAKLGALQHARCSRVD
jgi:hypothetical protein